jgi:hypothetical protein
MPASVQGLMLPTWMQPGGPRLRPSGELTSRWWIPSTWPSTSSRVLGRPNVANYGTAPPAMALSPWIHSLVTVPGYGPWFRSLVSVLDVHILPSFRTSSLSLYPIKLRHFSTKCSSALFNKCVGERFWRPSPLLVSSNGTRALFN